MTDQCGDWQYVYIQVIRLVSSDARLGWISVLETAVKSFGRAV